MATTVNILGDDFAQAAAQAGLRARLQALTAGEVIVYIDEMGRYVEELPDGRRFEVRLQPGTPRNSHIHILRELAVNGG